ncbi:MAG: hypothetical protein IPM29_24590 [Planctomycetes bacterium]|nr:hypothetical protein [Planctomycetota bacterium]
MTSPLLTAPADTAHQTYRTLGYVDAYDAVLNCDYAFVAWQETDSDGAWRVRIRSSQTAGAVFEPDAMRTQARAAAARSEPWFAWGYSFDPSPGDPREIAFRVHVADGRPAEVEIRVRLRNADGSAGEARSVRFPWPR